jgi:hypothetical protein
MPALKSALTRSFSKFDVFEQFLYSVFPQIRLVLGKPHYFQFSHFIHQKKRIIHFYAGKNGVIIIQAVILSQFSCLGKITKVEVRKNMKNHLTFVWGGGGY